MNKKLNIIVNIIFILCVGVFIYYFVSNNTSEPQSLKPESWEGIYRGTVYISEMEKKSFGVIITEDDVRKVELMFRDCRNDVITTYVDNDIELELEKTDKIYFCMKSTSALENSTLSDETIGNVYVELRYINEDTITIKYGSTKEEMEECKPVELHHSVV